MAVTVGVENPDDAADENSGSNGAILVLRPCVILAQMGRDCAPGASGLFSMALSYNGKDHVRENLIFK